MQEADPAYSAQVLAVAQELYDFADNFRDLYHNSIPDANAFYQYVLHSVLLTARCRLHCRDLLPSDSRTADEVCPG